MKRHVRRIYQKIHPYLCALAHRERLIYNPIPPYEIFTEITTFCNLRCPTCPLSGGLDRPRGNMDIELFREIIRQAQSWASRVSLFLAGEPLFYPHLAEALEIASHSGLYTRIHSNGLLLDKDKIDILLGGHLDELSISFDGPTREHYDQIRVGGDFDQSLEKVKELMETRQSRGLNKPRLIIQSLCLKGESEQQIMEGNRALLNGYEHDEIKVIPTHSFGGYYKDHLRNAQASIDSYDACHMLYNRLTVLWDGRTLACCNDFEGRYLTGDIKEKPLRRIWNDKPIQQIRRILRDGGYNRLALCRECDVLWGGGNKRRVPFAGMALRGISQLLKPSQ